MPTPDQLHAVAYKAEHAAARRLAAAGMDPEQALRQVLTLAAGAAGLAHLLALREQARADDDARRAARAHAASARLVQRQSSRQAPAGAWRGWFDGSAHPNPGNLGIGALLCGPDGQRVEISRAAGYGNSGEAEYQALIALLEAALPLRPAHLVIHGDSRVVIDDVTLAPPGRGAAGLRELQAHVHTLMEILVKQVDAAPGRVELRWIPRHRNSDADRLSQLAAKTV